MLSCSKDRAIGPVARASRLGTICISAVAMFGATSANAYELQEWNWKYQANPIEARFVICEQDAPSGAANVIKQAAAKWNYSKLNISFDPNSCPQQRPLNYIEFVAMNVTGLTTSPSEPGTHNTKQCIIQFNKDKPWYLGAAKPGSDQNDLFSVALHEFGHCIGLLHIKGKGTVMQEQLDAGAALRDLTPDDIAGRNKIYGVP